MHWLPLLLAEGEQQPGGIGGLLQSLGPMAPMLIIAVVMFIMMSRNSAKQRREMADMLAKLKKTDKVTTSSGIIGVVVAIKEGEDEVTLRVDDTTNSRIRVLRSSIARITSEEQPQTTLENKTT